jgi:hypothetical protein
MPFEQPASGLDQGQWVRFELPDGPINVAIVESKSAEPFKIVDPDDIAAIKKRTQTSKCGRFVGIFLKAAKSRIAGGERVKTDAEGNPVLDKASGKPVMEKFDASWVYLPATIVPQRAVLGACGEQNVTWPHGGLDRTVHLLVDSLRNVEPLAIRDDVPDHRNETLYKEWDPADRPGSKAKIAG